MKFFGRILIFALLGSLPFGTLSWAAGMTAPMESSGPRGGFLVAAVAFQDLTELGYPAEQGTRSSPEGIGGSLVRLSQNEDLDTIRIRPAEDWSGEETQKATISDPLEPLNRAFFAFNDKLYFWVLKPVATGYETVVPEPLRVSVDNFFSNIRMPVRAINCLLQGKIQGFGTEIARFVLNSTVGIFGFGDFAKVVFSMEKQEEDFGQTLGKYGLGPGIYINWPFKGPSSLRDSIGDVGDGFLNPLDYIVDDVVYNVAVRGYDRLNIVSLSLGEYEAMKKAALDPYISMRDAYFQYRKNKIKR